MKKKSSTSNIKNKIKKFKKQGQYPRITKNWMRYRQEEPSKFVQKSFRNVPLSHTNYKGKIKGQRAVVGKLKTTKKWKIQSILKKKPKS
ncbi:MAG: hypothetical protein ACFFG0_51310 [Candidatus Thorarchaeota archaeon]